MADAPRTQQQGPYPQQSTSPNLFNLALGQPSPRLLPKTLIAEASQAALRNADPLLFQYGCSPGTTEQRTQLARFLSRQHGLDVAPDELFWGSGTSQNLALLCSHLFARHSRKLIYAGTPTYFLAGSVFSELGAELRDVPLQFDGMDLDDLETRLRSGSIPAFVYVIPTYQNPTGCILSDAKRSRLVELAERFDFSIVADEPYNLLHLRGGAHAPLAHWDRGAQRVYSLGSFSKLLGPGLRSGWLHASPAQIRAFNQHGVFKSGGGLNPLAAEVISVLLRTQQLDHHLEQLRTVFGERAQRLQTAITNELPEASLFHDLKETQGAGGYFVWLDTRAYLGARTPSQLCELALQAGVAYTPGHRCHIHARDPDQCAHIRLSWAFYEADELESSCRRLAAAWD